MKNSRHVKLIFSIVLTLFIFIGCDNESPDPQYPEIDRTDKLPADISKRSPETDPHPPLLHSDAYEAPVPLTGGINTSGAEDSPFILPDGNTIYFFFTPDVRKPAEQQLFDSVTGIWVSHKIDNDWQEAERVWLQDPGKLALDGAVAIQEDEMWFASAREGYTGVNMFTAEFTNGKWANWTYSGDRLMKEIQVGEVHLRDNELYFHSARTGGHGSFDIWVTTGDGNNWSDPVNIDAVNSADMDGWPYVSADGKELWFTRWFMGTPALYRSVKNNGVWSEPEIIISQFAGEPTLDNEGNIFFVHHYYENNVMIEADIYVAYKK